MYFFVKVNLTMSIYESTVMATILYVFVCEVQSYTLFSNYESKVLSNALGFIRKFTMKAAYLFHFSVLAKSNLIIPTPSLNQNKIKCILFIFLLKIYFVVFLEALAYLTVYQYIIAYCHQ
jgi:hypothetical protein